MQRIKKLSGGPYWLCLLFMVVCFIGSIAIFLTTCPATDVSNGTAGILLIIALMLVLPTGGLYASRR